MNNNTPQYPIPYTVYKRKAALRLSMVLPKMRDNNGSQKARPGALLFEIANAVGEKKYNWEEKIVFSLNAKEVVDIDRAIRQKADLSIYHDPGKGQENEGQIVKTLKLQRYKDDSGTIFQFAMKKNGEWQKAVIVLDDSEYMLLRSFMFHAIPRLYNW